MKKTIIQRINLIKDQDALAKIRDADDHQSRLSLISDAFVALNEIGAIDILRHIGCSDIFHRGTKVHGRPHEEGAPDFETTFHGATVGVEVTEFVADTIGFLTRKGALRSRSLGRVLEELQSTDVETLARHIPDAPRALRGFSYYVVTDALTDVGAAESASTYDLIRKIIGSATPETARDVDTLFNNYGPRDFESVGVEFYRGWLGSGKDKVRLWKRLTDVPQNDRAALRIRLRSAFYAAARQQTDAAHGAPLMAIFRVAMANDAIGIVSILPTAGRWCATDVTTDGRLEDVARRKMIQMRKAEEDGRNYDQRWLLLADPSHESAVSAPDRGRKKDGWLIEYEKSDLAESLCYWDRIVFYDSVAG